MKVAVYCEVPAWIVVDTQTRTVTRFFTNEHDADNRSNGPEVYVMQDDGWMSAHEAEGNDLAIARQVAEQTATLPLLEVIPG